MNFISYFKIFDAKKLFSRNFIFVYACVYVVYLCVHVCLGCFLQQKVYTLLFLQNKFNQIFLVSPFLYNKLNISQFCISTSKEHLIILQLLTYSNLKMIISFAILSFAIKKKFIIIYIY